VVSSFVQKSPDLLSIDEELIELQSGDRLIPMMFGKVSRERTIFVSPAEKN
jgi:hypothetical protein